MPSVGRQAWAPDGWVPPTYAGECRSRSRTSMFFQQQFHCEVHKQNAKLRTQAKEQMIGITEEAAAFGQITAPSPHAGGSLSLSRRSFALHSMALAQVISNASAGETCVVPPTGKNSTARTFVCPEPLDSEKDTYCCGFSPNYFCCSKPFDTFAVVMGGILTSVLFLAVSYAIIAYIHNFFRRRRARRIQHGMPPCRTDSGIFQFAEGLSAEEREKAILAKVTGDGGPSQRASPPPSPQHRLLLPAADCRKNSSSTFNDDEDAGRNYREDMEDRVELDEDMFMTDVRTRRSSEERLTGATSGPHDHAAVVIVPSDNQPQGRTAIA
ncbi:Hypp5138 [Branchiostoma lanceolatum]|uniref:Hypp5138 protein n=1 Tax=Branchiostoma lanceolatum TaxID=7740 RepID=A0A8K0ACN2_BRALA|nr:Hypp5138 [Branchiostoma lanceolatum]